MCGIAGCWRPQADVPADVLADTARRMTRPLGHRGPDDEGVWVDAAAGVALGHRRLSIVDLSPLGHQPMASASSRYVLSFNGELYNFPELRDELAGRGHRFLGGSDTEVLLAACDEWGLDGALERFNGMFAFALWDHAQRVLHLVRDRLGEKPLYYGWVDGTLLFGSEMRALRAHPDAGGRLDVDRDALSLYLRLNYVPAPHSIYGGVAKLPAGTVLSVRAGDGPGTGTRPKSYWPLAEVVAKARSNPLELSEDEATDRLDVLLREAVRMRMHADVPLGAFLSGGIDSSTVVALMQAQADRPVRTFTVGFADPSLDESGHARLVAGHLGTDHTEVHVSPDMALALVPRLGEIYDEPFADPSQLPTIAISEVARRHVTVCLSGDGGDEVFGGYNRYTQGQRAWDVLGRVPLPARRLAAQALLAAPPAVLGRLVPAAKAQKLAALLRVGSADDVYPALVSAWDEPDSLVVGGCEPVFPPADGVPAQLEGLVDRMMFLDTLSTLPDEMLAKVDRASMSVALEVRVPLLDPRVVELAWALPPGLRIKDGKGKWLLRKVLYRYVPRDLVERPKIGFDPPIAEWLRGPLRPWAQELLDPERLQREGYLRPGPVGRCWAEHLSGARNWDYRLWAVLMFQAWLERQATAR
jgi:asparagine synthase (glutamine-hydrolysing)